MSTERILVFDTTLRDGEQSPECTMNVQEKFRMGTQLEKLGVDIRAELTEVYHRFTRLADRKKKIYDQDLLSLLVPEKQTTDIDSIAV